MYREFGSLECRVRLPSHMAEEKHELAQEGPEAAKIADGHGPPVKSEKGTRLARKKTTIIPAKHYTISCHPIVLSSRPAAPPSFPSPVLDSRSYSCMVCVLECVRLRVCFRCSLLCCLVQDGGKLFQLATYRSAQAPPCSRLTYIPWLLQAL